MNPSPGRSARPAVLPVKTPPPARTLPKPGNVKGLPNTTQQVRYSPHRMRITAWQGLLNDENGLGTADRTVLRCFWQL